MRISSSFLLVQAMVLCYNIMQIVAPRASGTVFEEIEEIERMARTKKIKRCYV